MMAVTKGSHQWTVRRVYCDPAGSHDTGVSAIAELAGPAQRGIELVRMTGIGMLRASLEREVLCAGNTVNGRLSCDQHAA
jgi:hypothetical protein